MTQTDHMRLQAEAAVRQRIHYVMCGRVSANRIWRTADWEQIMRPCDWANARAIQSSPQKNPEIWMRQIIDRVVIFGPDWFSETKQESYRAAPDMFAAKESQAWLWENRDAADNLLIDFCRAVFLLQILQQKQGGLAI